MLEAPELAGAAQAGDDLVANEQDVVLGADVADVAPVLRRRDEDALVAADWLGDERGDAVGPFAENRALELGSAAFDAAGGILFAVRATVAVGRKDLKVTGGKGR